MNGHIIPNSNIAVDFWKIKGRQDNLIHFLTHLHGDHIVGLTSSWNKPIYCSNITAELLKSKYGISNKLLRVLPLNESVHIDTPSFGSFTVTTFDANHCPGAVMFYFQGPFGNIFYTGDFRASESLTEACLNLKGKINVLYLDNTFCSPKCIFPSQEECFDKIVEIIQQHPDHSVVIGVRNLGKEFMLGRLGAALNETIAVTSEMYNLCKFLLDTNVFTTIHCHEGFRLRTIPLQQITRQYLRELNQNHPHIAIIPTAIYTGLGFDPFATCPDIFVVPYSDHSSYTELLHFVSVLKPAQVVPIVTGTKGPFCTDISDRTDMSCFESFLSNGTASPEDNTFKSNLLINHQFESISDCQATAHRNLQVKKDVEIYCNKKVCLNYDTETPVDIIRKRKRKNPPCRIKKKARGVIFEEPASDESADRTTPSPEPGNDISMENYYDTVESVLEQGSEKPEFHTKCASQKLGENSLVSVQQCYKMDCTEENVGVSFHKPLEEEQEPSSSKEKQNDFSSNNSNRFGDKSVHNTYYDHNINKLAEDKDKKSSLDLLDCSEPPISCVFAVDTKTHLHTESFIFSSVDIYVGDIPKDTSENNITKTHSNQESLKTTQRENNAQIASSQVKETNTTWNVTWKQNLRQKGFVTSRPLNKNIKKHSETQCCSNAGKIISNLGDEVSSHSTFPFGIIENGTKVKNSSINSQSPANKSVIDLQNSLGNVIPKTQNLIKPYAQQKLQTYPVPLKKNNNKITSEASRSLVKFDKNLTETRLAIVREIATTCPALQLSDKRGNETSTKTQGAPPENCLLLAGRETIQMRPNQEMKSSGTDRSFVNAIKAFLAKK